MSHSLSAVKIANMALSNIGARSTIESLDEPSAEAKQCKLWYDFARVSTLEAYNWNFARKRQALAEHSEAAPTDVWTYRYIYPSDCIVARELENPLGYAADAVPFTVETDSTGVNKSILTNLEDARLIYTFDVELVSLFPALFVDAFSYALAARIAFSLTAKTSIKKDMMEAFREMVISAAASSGNEQIEQGPREAEWIRGRQ